MRSIARLFFITMLFICRCAPEESMPVNPVPAVEKIDLLALGDSYTKGESVKWEQNFPNQLADSLRQNGFEWPGLHVVAQTGWRTDNLQNALLQQSGVIGDSIFSLVTLCIGVNNQYQNANFETYKKQFEELLQYAIARAGERKERVIVVSIPDWAYTPFGQSWGNPSNTSQKIDQYNAANQVIADSHQVAYVNITEVSRNGLLEPELVALDGLHPSALQYTAWVKLILPIAQKALKQ